MRLLVIGVTQESGVAWARVGAHLALAEGEFHALVGAAGAGKTAFLEVLGGFRRPARGLMLLDGQPYTPRSPEAARRAGVWLAGRGDTLAEALSVEENLVLGMEPARRGWIDRAARRAQACRALAELPGAAIPPGALVGSLSVADRRRVEIARALLVLPKVLLFEEDHPVLPAPSGAFATILRRLAARGVSVLYATRSAETARQLCTRYTLLSRGAAIASGRTRGAAAAALEAEETSREAGPFPRLSRHCGRALLQVRDGPTVHEGEIVGIACAGPPPRDDLFGAPRGGGILPGLSLADNLTLPCLRRFSALGLLSLARQETAAVNWLQKLQIRARSPYQDAALLAPQDQPKLLIGRLLLERAPVLALEAPTRGLAGPGKREVHALLQSAAAEGRGIVLFSRDPAELLALCDTVAVPRRERLADCRPAGEWTESELAAALQGLS